MAALTITLVLFGLAAAVGLAQEQVVSNLTHSTHAVKRGGGAILILVGAWLVILAIWAGVFARIFPL